MKRKRTPDRMVKNGVVVEYGAFESPFENANISDARISLGGIPMPHLYASFRLKEWQHFGIIAEDVYFGFAIVNARYLGNSFCYILERKTGHMVEYERMAPPGVARVARDLWKGECGFDFRDYRIFIDNRLSEGFHGAQVLIGAEKDKPPVRAEIEVEEGLDRVEPLELVSRLKGNRPAYTHKVACPACGEIRVGDRTYTFDRHEGIAIIDVNRTFFPYETFWNWATCGGHDEQGRLVALNLSRGISIREEEINDNCLWVDGKISFLGPSRFTLDEKAILEPWHIETAGGTCVLDFQPQGERWGNIDLLFLVSDFHQPYGTFGGEAVDSEGEVHQIRDYFGVVEHHLARF